MESAAFSATARSGNVGRLYDETAATHPNRLAIETNSATGERTGEADGATGGRSGTTYTHADLRDRSARFAGGLRDLGLTPGDRVGVFLPNRPAFVVAALGAIKAGTPFVPLNPQFRPREVAYRLDDADAAAVVVHESLLGTLETALDGLDADPTVVVHADGAPRSETGDDARGVLDGSAGDDRTAADVRFVDVDGEPFVAGRDGDDVAMQPYTSGTTGEPKGVLLTHRNLRAQSFVGFERTTLDAEEERFLSVLPLSHIAGFVNRTWQPLVRGASVYLRDPQEWDPGAAMATIEAESITKFGAVAAMYVDIINHESFGEYDLSSLAEAMEGGTDMPVAVQERFEAEAEVDLFEAYGLTETGGGTHAGINATFGPRPGTVGQPFRATDCKVVDEDGEEVSPGESGELLVRGPHVMAGYHDRPDETADAFTDDGYLRTGDVVRRDEDNYYEVLGRKSDVILTAGYNVYPNEVEEVLHEHPSVEDASVAGVPDDRRGETVKAFVVPADGTDPDAERLRQHCLEHMAAYKHPREVEFVQRLPRTTSGKVQRFKLASGGDD
ncbi:class I adenylate-forming enzyme family protein [Halomicrococcus gelatinilyticus]|uniref:class I adenylate-forming enzyme family protein n=1 Tax=Halomicrococcus gelatinilyticus TaxID=1702103 RepID=UPI002E122F51